MSKRLIYVVGASDYYACWMQGQVIYKMEDADLVVFTGGEDVSPQLYGKKANPNSGFNIHRDLEEIEEYGKARLLGKHIIGICRGSQFLCVMNGGILVQHQFNVGRHSMYTSENRIIEVSSTHHQAQYPFDLPKDDYKILGWTHNISPFHFGQTMQEELNPIKECEIVFYPKTKCLAIQSHPEMMVNDKNSTLYMQNLLNDFMADKL